MTQENIANSKGLERMGLYALSGIILFAIGGTILFFLIIETLAAPSSYSPGGDLTAIFIAFLLLGAGLYLMMRASTGRRLI